MSCLSTCLLRKLLRWLKRKLNCHKTDHSKCLQELNDWALLHLFDRVPLRDLRNLGATCARFEQVKAKSCALRRELTIFVGDDLKCEPKKKNHPFNCVHVTHLTRANVEQLMVLLPKISSLSIINRTFSVDIRNSLINLLANYAPKLVRLKLCLSYASKDAEQVPMFPLIEVINNLPVIKELAIIYKGKLFLGIADPQEENDDEDNPQVHLSILSRLELFSLNTRDEFKMMLPTMQWYASENAALRKLTMINPINKSIEDVDNFLALDRTLARKFTLLCINSWQVSIAQLTDLFQHFNLLTGVRLLWTTCNLSQFSRALSLLPNLTTLTIWIERRVRINLREQAEANGMPIEPETMDANQVVSLPSVKQVTLQVCLTDHTDLTELYLDRFLPNLETFKICIYSCDTCGDIHNSNCTLAQAHCCMFSLYRALEGFPKRSLWRTFSRLRWIHFYSLNHSKKLFLTKTRHLSRFLRSCYYYSAKNASQNNYKYYYSY